MEEKKEEESPSQMEEAKKLVEEMKKQNEELKRNLERAEQLEANKILGGETSAGKQEETEEEKALKSAKALISGSGFEDRLN